MTRETLYVVLIGALALTIMFLQMWRDLSCQ